MKGITIPILELESGIVVSDAFVRIVSVIGDPDIINIGVRFFASEKFYDEGKSFIVQSNYTFRHDNSSSAYNVFRQGYEYLKTLPEFEGARDA